MHAEEQATVVTENAAAIKFQLLLASCLKSKWQKLQIALWWYDVPKTHRKVFLDNKKQLSQPFHQNVFIYGLFQRKYIIVKVLCCEHKSPTPLL